MVADYFTRNLHYASTYWEEHSLNFAEMLDQLMTEQTLERLCANASMMVLSFNQKCGMNFFLFLGSLMSQFNFGCE
jgi:hypothetical protein